MIRYLLKQKPSAIMKITKTNYLKDFATMTWI